MAAAEPSFADHAGIILSGIPGSGKSTIALVKVVNELGVVRLIAHCVYDSGLKRVRIEYVSGFDASSKEVCRIVSADYYYTDEKGMYHYDRAQIYFAHKTCLSQVVIAKAAGVSHIIVDNTNAKTKDMKQYLRVLGEKPLLWRISIDEEHLPQCIKRCAHSVPGNIVKAMWTSITAVDRDQLVASGKFADVYICAFMFGEVIPELPVLEYETDEFMAAAPTESKDPEGKEDAKEEAEEEKIQEAFVYAKLSFPKLDKKTKKMLNAFLKPGWGRQLSGATIAFGFEELLSIGGVGLNVGQKVGLRLVAVRESVQVCAFRVELVDEATNIGFGRGRVTANDKFFHVTICCAPRPEEEGGKFYPPSLAKDLSAEGETLLGMPIEIETVVTAFLTERRTINTLDDPLATKLNAALDKVAVTIATSKMAELDMSA